jgi:hypothetical protein
MKGKIVLWDRVPSIDIPAGWESARRAAARGPGA